MNKPFDLIVIGGGINGTALAADAAGRGLSVLLCEKNDLASGTSSASTKLIHGGLRYLEFFEFNLVRKALREREILMRRAPNLIVPLEFVLPHNRRLRPAWLIRLGLFFYDHLSKRNVLPASHQIDLSKDLRGEALQDMYKTGFSYYDCFTDDARLVMLNALSARENKGVILTRTEFISARRDNEAWHVLLKDHLSNEETSYTAKGLINAAGPWVNTVHDRIEGSGQPLNIQLDKGSHIIVPKLYEGNFAYILQSSDNRIVFTIPYHEKYTLIGTTDRPYNEKVDSVHIDEEEIRYLCSILQAYFKKNISSDEIIYSYSGVRCLQNEPHTRVSKITRDYKLILNDKWIMHDKLSPFLLTIIGGKLTTHRLLAEEAVDLLKPFFPSMGDAWTGRQPLPGCQFENQDFGQFYEKLWDEYPALPRNLLLRYARSYGTFVYDLLGNAQRIEDLGEKFSDGLFSDDLYEREVNYLIEKEWARTAEDILWRRSKLGLGMTEQSQCKLAEYLAYKLDNVRYPIHNK